MLGQRVAHYTVVERLGAGGMGEVYLASDTALGRQVALKFLHTQQHDREAMRRRFLQEARAAAALDHPNIGTIYEIGEWDNQVFIAMAYYEGETLRSLLSRGRLPIAQALDLAAQIADGLAYAHSRKIAHRDIKPGNLILTENGRIKIVDFGLAKAELDVNATQTLMVGGTPAYMSPEQAMGEPTNFLADIWSWAVVVYEMVSGVRPFAGENSQALVAAIVHRPYAPVRDLRPDTPPEVEEVIAKALAKDPKERLSSLAGVSAKLLSLLGRSATRAYETSPRPETAVVTASPATTTSATPDRDSLAVLPLRNMNGDQEGEFFTEGLTDELISALSKLPKLRVVSRSSAFQFKDRPQDLASIAKALKVAYVLDGSARRAGNRVRVTAQLINASDESVLWSDKYDRGTDQVFEIQDEIAAAITEALQKTLNAGAAPPAEARHRHVVRPEAYDQYLKGRYHLNRSNPVELKKAIEAFEAAVAADPSFAAAYTGLADAFLIAQHWGVLPPEEGRKQAKAAATRALELDDQLAEAHNSMAAALLTYGWEWAAMAEREFKRALELNPNYSSACFWYATGILLPQGRLEEACAMMERAMQSDPLSPAIRTGSANTYLLAGRPSLAIKEAQRALELDANYLEGIYALASAYTFSARPEDAIQLLESTVERFGERPWTLTHLAVALARQGDVQRAREILKRIKELSAGANFSPMALVYVHVALDEIDQALEYFKKAAAEKDSRALYVLYDPKCARLKADPRFSDLLKSLHFARPDQHETWRDRAAFGDRTY